MSARGGSARDRKVTWFTVALAAAGAATGLAAQAAGGPTADSLWWQAPLVLGVLALASHLIIRVQFRDQVEALDLFEAVLAPAIVVFPGLAAVGLAAAAKALVGALHRNEGMKARFNVALWAAATGCGALTYAGLHAGSELSARNVLALGAAMFAVAVVNHAGFAAVLAFASGRSLAAVIEELRPVIVIGWVGGSAVNAAFGLLFVSAYLQTPAAILLMVIALVVLYGGSRGFATARTDRVRLTGLQTATHVLAGPVDPREAFPLFVAEVQRCFEADAVDLYVVTPDGPVRHRVATGVPVSSGPDDGTSAAARLAAAAALGPVVVDARHDPRGLLASEGWRIAAAAPLHLGERMLGALCVYNRGGAEGFEQGETVVLEALAAEVVGALEKAELLAGMLEERRQLADIVGSTSDGIVTLDERGVVTSWNSGLEQITGYDAVEMLGRVPALLRPTDEHGHPIPITDWRGRVEQLPVAVEITTADRQSRWLSCSYTELPPRDGRGVQLVIVARDVTKVHELDTLKNDFVAVVSHELRTPLAPMKGWAMTLLTRGEELSKEQRREAARSILRQAERLEQLILNILEDSRIESDLTTAAADEIIDVGATVTKIVEDFRLLVPDRVIAVTGGETGLTAVGRTVRIEQVVANLLSNAVKYAPKGEPIDVSIDRIGTFVTVAVTDRGPGIAPEARERIFQRFERLSDSPAQTGTGLGLYIARQLAATMGATLDVSPAPHGGSTFTLRLRALRELAVAG